MTDQRAILADVMSTCRYARDPNEGIYQTPIARCVEPGVSVGRAATLAVLGRAVLALSPVLLPMTEGSNSGKYCLSAAGLDSPDARW